MSKRDAYISPFQERYGSKEMQYLFSEDKKFSTWRKLWVALAESEMELGLTMSGKPVITPEMIEEMKEHIYDINYEVAESYETKLRHDVMSHIKAYGEQCPKAAGIIHLGATSCYVGDNTDIIVMKEALDLLKKKLVNVIDILSKFADSTKAIPTLAYTHFQAAQPTTVGKRATLWLQDFVSDLKDLEYVSASLKLLGCKGTTGTQASFVELFQSKDTPVKLDKLIAKKMGFKEVYPVSGQTYSRKVDARVYNVLSGIAGRARCARICCWAERSGYLWRRPPDPVRRSRIRGCRSSSVRFRERSLRRMRPAAAECLPDGYPCFRSGGIRGSFRRQTPVRPRF